MEIVQSIDKIFLFRILGEEGNAWKVAFQTESETEESREYETEVTKDGSVKSSGLYEGTHSMSSFLAKGDIYVRKLKELIRDNPPGKLEIWEIDRSGLNDGGANTIPGDYSVDVVTSVSTTASAEGNVEISIETEVEGTIVSGEVNVTGSLRELLKQITAEREFVQPTEEERGEDEE